MPMGRRPMGIFFSTLHQYILASKACKILHDVRYLYTAVYIWSVRSFFDLENHY